MRETPPSENVLIDLPIGTWAKRDASLYWEAYGRVDANGYPKGALIDSEKLIATRLPPAQCYTDEKWTELGQQMAANPQAITTNIEGKAYLDYTNDQRRLLRDRYGCCGEEASDDGYCFGLGLCTRHHEIQSCVTFVAGFLAWIDQLSEQAGLAAVASRLSDSSPLSS